MKKIAFILGFAVVVLSLTSCKKSLPEVGGTAAEKMANEWWVTFTLNGADIYGLGHVKIKTYNTAANTGEIWVDDFPNFVDSNHVSGNTWAFQVKAKADFTNMTFSAAQSESVVRGYRIKVDITDGKVLANAGRSKSGLVTDSIYMKIKFEDDPTSTYQIAGHARTKFIEDEY